MKWPIIHIIIFYIAIFIGVLGFCLFYKSFVKIKSKPKCNLEQKKLKNTFIISMSCLIFMTSVCLYLHHLHNYTQAPSSKSESSDDLALHSNKKHTKNNR